MEQDKKIRIVTNDEALLKECINWYNKVYGTDFYFIEFVRDEVNFAIIGFNSANSSEIFDLGCIYGIERESKK